MIANRITQTKLLEDVTSEPVTLKEAKDYVHQSGDVDDDLIRTLITSARKQCEQYAGICIGYQKMQWYFGHNAERPIYLNWGPVSLTSVKHRTCRLNPYVALDADKYELEGSYFFGGYEGMYIVEGYCGSSDILEDHKAAILAQVAFVYMNRGDSLARVSDLCPEAQSIMRKYKIFQ